MSAAAQTPADREFERRFGADFFDRVWQLHPDAAIAVGYYRYADRLVVPDEAARATELRALEEWTAALRSIDPGALSPSVRADWEILANAFAAERWSLVEYRPWQWDPSYYNVAEPLALLTTLEYAPLETRLRAVLARLERVPAYYVAARRNIDEPTLVHTRLAIEQNRGTLDVLGASLESLVASSGLDAGDKALFATRLSAAREAVAEFGGWLEALAEELARRGGARDFRLGAELYARKFELQIQSGDTAEALYRCALEEKERLHRRMATLAELLWPTYFPNEPVPEDRLTTIGRVIERLSEEHIAPEDFLTEVRRQIPELEQWVRDHDLIALDPEKPLQVRETPVYKRGIARASIDAPGPYDPTAPTYYNVTPLDDLPPEAAENYLREYNRWMLPVLNIHEAVPGHYVQLVYANKSPSLVKSVYGNGAMIEGWAVYAERMMLESGYGGHTAQSWLIYSKWNLRSVCNAILDYGVHVLGMREREALDLLMREAFQTRQEAVEKWRRVQLTSVQLTSYFAGYSAIMDLRERLMRERGERFSLRGFHEEFLSFGNAPVAVIGGLMRAPSGG